MSNNIDSVIEINNLSKTYSDGTQALKNVDLSIKRGDFFALLGPNGAGKSTLLNIISSLTKKTTGTVNICGYNLEEDEFHAKLSLGITPQEFNMNIFQKSMDSLVIQAGYYGIKQKEAEKIAEKNLKLLGLYDKRNSIAKSLSGGMKRRLMIARALMHEPQVLILDEPTAGVDVEVRHKMWEFIRRLNEQGITIVLTTHYLEEAEQLCNNISIINQGEILLNSSMKQLLSAKYSKTILLDVESFDLDLSEPPNDIAIIKNSPENLEACISADTTLNDLFAYLATNNIKVLNFRNKTNRIEELFMKLTSPS